ncbi:MAG TPA: hypothetical protein PK020_09090 [Ilumatobacteraceae bacterium]|nr:hypothetical protein [Ilumatobacteraceae bacterium]
MRQFFTFRFWLTIAALCGLALAVTAFAKSRESDADPLAADVGTATPERTIDVVAWVYAVQPPPGFAIVDGRANKDMTLIVDGTRTMIITAGTPGEMDCPRYAELAQCTVAADLLGDGVLWFSIIKGVPGPTVELPAVAELLDGGWVRLENGWVVQHAPKVERSCAEDTASLNDFIDLFGATAKSTFNFEQQQIVKVTCPGQSSTTTTFAPTTTLDPAILDPVTLDTSDTSEAG